MHPDWKDVEGLLVLRVPEGTAFLSRWLNPSYRHGVIVFADGRMEHVPTTDHFGNQRHMKDVPRPQGKEPFESSEDAARTYVEWRLGLLGTKEPSPTVWNRLSEV